MKDSTFFSTLCAGILTITSITVHAEIINRGDGMIYDSDLNLTWLQDGSYLYTSGYPDNDGLVPRATAITWVSSLVYAGLDDWRLPGTLNVDPSCSTDATDKLYLTLTPCSGGEMGHLLYSEELIFQPGLASIGNGLPLPPNTGKRSWGLLGPFDNVYGGGYWTSEDYVWTGQSYEDPAGTLATPAKPYPRTPKDDFGWLFYVGGDPGAHKTLLATTANRAVWPVRDGFDIHLAANRWTMIGLPYTPAQPATVSSVFGDDLNTGDYGTRWVMYEWDAFANNYTKLLDTNSTLSQDKGYWIYSLDAANLDVAGNDTPVVLGNGCAVAEGCYEIQLTKPSNGIEQYNMIGHSFPSGVPWKDVRIRTEAGTVVTVYNTPTDAWEANIMDKTFWRYNGGGYDQYDDITPTDGQLAAFDGFWVRTLPGASAMDSITLLLPKVPAS